MTPFEKRYKHMVTTADFNTQKHSRIYLNAIPHRMRKMEELNIELAGHNPERPASFTPENSYKPKLPLTSQQLVDLTQLNKELRGESCPPVAEEIERSTNRAREQFRHQ